MEEATRSNHHIPLPSFKTLQRVSASMLPIASLEREIYESLQGLHLPVERLAGMRIAVTAGSRGIADLKETVRSMCRWLREQGAEPFVVPAMGSHGGAVAEGQRRILEEYGLREQYITAPVVSSLDTVRVGETPQGFQVFMDRNAFEADGVLVMNRVKPHTDFSGKIESGRLKMIAVGLGKQRGAGEVHRWARKYGYEPVIRAICEVVLASGKILGGLAVVENEVHRVCHVRAARPEDMVTQEEEVLAMARRLVPGLPLSDLQVLIVNELGKNISGTGMDTKVIGRGVDLPPGQAPSISMIYVRDLTDESGGNAVGMGNADLVHERFYRKVDLSKTYINARTSLKAGGVRLPMHLPSDRDALDFALGSLGSPEPEEQRLAWIQNTLELGSLAVSEALRSEVENLPGWDLSVESFKLEFDAEGDLMPAPCLPAPGP